VYVRIDRSFGMEDLEGVYRAIPSATNEPLQAPLKDVRISWSEAFVVMGDPKGTAKLEAPAANALMEKASILEKVGPADQAVEAAVDDMVTVSVTESGSKRSGTTSAAVGIGPLVTDAVPCQSRRRESEVVGTTLYAWSEDAGEAGSEEGVGSGARGTAPTVPKMGRDRATTTSLCC